MENVPRTHHTADPRNPKFDGTIEVCTRIFSERIILMSMFNDIIWANKPNKLTCLENSAMVSEYAKCFAQFISGLSKVIRETLLLIHLCSKTC